MASYAEENFQSLQCRKNFNENFRNIFVLIVRATNTMISFSNLKFIPLYIGISKFPCMLYIRQIAQN